MKLVRRSVQLLYPEDARTVMRRIEEAGRNCYQSYQHMTDGSAEALIRKFVKANHGSPLEFADITVRIVADRAFLAQITRHRLASFCVESARYNDYKGGCKFIEPVGLEDGEQTTAWLETCAYAESTYDRLRELGVKPETARSVLPMSLATSIVMKANVREWRHILELRLDKHAQPDMRQIMEMALDVFYLHYPVLFEDLWDEYGKEILSHRAVTSHVTWRVYGDVL